MSATRTFATARRVLKQLQHDPRTIFLVLFVPPILMTILKYTFDKTPTAFDHLAPMVLGIFPMTMMFLITSIATLRERTSGTLDRLMTMPISKLDFILGYAIAFSVLGLVQALISSFVMIVILGVSVTGGTLATIIGVVCASFLGTSLGLFTSAFARSEFQAIQFMPAFIFPQLLTCGLFVARDQMADILQWFAKIMPLTYSVDAMKQITTQADWGSTLTWDLITVVIFGVAVLILGSATIRRQS
jgi:ABC-2 type transport system permease protein